MDFEKVIFDKVRVIPILCIEIEGSKAVLILEDKEASVNLHLTLMKEKFYPAKNFRPEITE
jgi:hypothetical protein